MRIPPMQPPGKIAVFAVLVAGVAVWVIVLLLLLEASYQLVDTLRFIVELGSMK
jgi:hypothetical protein